MKCPKCHYISFESSERCRNCGYEFSLAVGAEGFDLPIQTGQEAIGPLGDFALGRDEPSASTVVSVASPQPRPITSSFDLPLFKERRREEESPLVTPAAVPRAPLAVRRSTPAPRGANRTTADEPVLFEAPTPFERLAARLADAPAPPLAASVGPRFLAALVDATILGSIALAVLYLTLFTAAGGQTIGKMAAGIKVVSTDVHHLRVPLGHSVLRAAAYLASALPAGLGFLPAVFGADRRAIHDRLADTRVVKA